MRDDYSQKYFNTIPIYTKAIDQKPPLEAIATEENQTLQRLARLSRLKELVEKNPEFVEFLALAKEFGL